MLGKHGRVRTGFLTRTQPPGLRKGMMRSSVTGLEPWICWNKEQSNCPYRGKSGSIQPLSLRACCSFLLPAPTQILLRHKAKCYPWQEAFPCFIPKSFWSFPHPNFCTDTHQSGNQSSTHQQTYSECLHCSKLWEDGCRHCLCPPAAHKPGRLIMLPPFCVPHTWESLQLVHWKEHKLWSQTTVTRARLNSCFCGS